MRKRILFIINPISGTRTKTYLFEMARDLAPDLFLTEIAYTHYGGHATQLAKRAAGLGYDAVIACGGDGTVHEIGCALIGTDVALGIIPLGSGNGIARHLGIPLSVPEALKTIIEFKITRIDTGVVNGEPFIGVAGLGFDALIGKKFAHSGKRGFLSYLKLVLKEYFGYREKKVIVTRGKKKITHKALMVTIANCSQFGNDVVIAPNADTCDGKLNLCIVKKFPLWKAPYIAWLLMSKKIDRSRYMTTLEVKRLRIKQPKKLVHLDGEPVKMSKQLNVKIIPSSLNVIVTSEK